MACFLYNGGKYSLLAGQHIAKGGVLLPLQADDYLVLRGIAYPIGSKMISPEISSADVTHINGEEPSGRKWYVTPDGSGAKDGSSWENACGIADMLWLMLQVQQGDNIYFAEGDYPFPQVMQVPSGVSFYGGFTSQNLSWEKRNGLTHPSVFYPASGTKNELFVNADKIFDGISFHQVILKNIQHLRNCMFSDGSFYYNPEIAGSSSVANIHFLGTELSAYACNECVFTNCSGKLGPLYDCSIRSFQGSVGGMTRCIVCDCSDIYLSGFCSNSDFYRISASTLSKSGFAQCMFDECNIEMLVDCSTPYSDPGSCSYDKISIINSRIKYLGLANRVSCSDLTIVNSVIERFWHEDCNGGDVNNAKIYNSEIYRMGQSYNEFINSLIVNSTCANSVFVSSTLVNCGDVGYQGVSSVFFNCSYVPNFPEYCALPTYTDGKANIVIGHDNTLTKFSNTGLFPALGPQDIGKCPSPKLAPEEYSAYISLFGDWHPCTGSALSERGLASEFITTDLDGIKRPNPPTIGCYEPIIQGE